MIFSKDTPFDGKHCFLCGCQIEAKTGVGEHVFPKWLQKKYNLWDKQLVLLNGTRLPYRKLTIPCCAICNTTHLSKLEVKVKTIISDDSRSLDELSDHDLNVWVSKIFIGILWKEMQLKVNRKSPDAGHIFTPEFMQKFRMMHFMLQACRKNMRFVSIGNKFPNTILRFNCKNLGSGPINF